MKELKRDIYIINANYPYGKTETFLENEIKFLAPYFNKIHLFPLNYPSSDFHIREVPRNVIYQNALLDKKHYKRIVKFLFKRSPIKNHFIDLKYVFSSKNGFYLEKIKRWFLSFLVDRALYNSQHYKNIKDNIKSTDILYFYWGGAKSIYASRFNHPNTFIRVHGGEIDLERHNNYIPLYKKLLQKNVTYLSISDKIYNKLLSLNPDLKVKINRLGTFDYGLNSLDKSSDVIKIVTCSNVIPLKRLHLIVDALKLINDTKIEWIHFGDGPLLNEIKLKAKKLDDNIKASFKGRVLNENVMNFYKTQSVNAFINVSTTEGIPVSIMEAMSFGIPCFATDVGATSELVNESNGQLVPVNFTALDLVNFIIDSKSKNYILKRKNARTKWENYSNANSNYLQLLELFSA